MPSVHFLNLFLVFIVHSCAQSLSLSFLPFFLILSIFTHFLYVFLLVPFSYPVQGSLELAAQHVSETQKGSNVHVADIKTIF